MIHCQLCETRDAMGGYLCPGCTKATIVRLELLPALYDGLAAFLQPSVSARTGRTSAAVDAPLPAAELPLTMRGPGGMVGVTEDWLSAVHQDRRMSEPRRAGTHEQRLARAVAGLLANMPWVSMSWPAAGAFAEEIRELANSARSVISPVDPAEVGKRIGACPAVDVSGVICGAILRHRPGETVIVCTWCGCSFPPATWPGLKVFIDHDERNEIRDEKEEAWPSAS